MQSNFLPILSVLLIFIYFTLFTSVCNSVPAKTRSQTVDVLEQAGPPFPYQFRYKLKAGVQLLIQCSPFYNLHQTSLPILCYSKIRCFSENACQNQDQSKVLSSPIRLLPTLQLRVMLTLVRQIPLFSQLTFFLTVVSSAYLFFPLNRVDLKF